MSKKFGVRVTLGARYLPKNTILICVVEIIFITKLCVNQIIELIPVSKTWGISSSKTIMCTVKVGCMSHLSYKHVDQTEDRQFHLLCE
jgi:hypothetical protein